MRRKPELHLFDGYGIELEYVIVDSESLDVLPISDEVLRTAEGKYTCEVDAGEIVWSNEFVLHVLELKTGIPVASLSGLSRVFEEHVGRINRLLAPKGGRLMPAAMHPWMDPARETRFWPHKNRRIYQTYDRIFNCRNHGWSNIQSMQVNLPFCGDDEFGRLHAAVRILLPLMPVLAAASPVVEGRTTGLLDTRLEYYRGNQRRVPSVTGEVVPEPVYTDAEYHERILKHMYRDIAPYDPEGVLRHEWLNSRGAIARFDRSAIEIRILDVQECPCADLAIAAAIIETLRALVAERWMSRADQASWETTSLVEILNQTIRLGNAAVIDHAEYLKAFGFQGVKATAGEVWQYLLDEVLPPDAGLDKEYRAALTTILDQGCLSLRVLKALGEDESRERMRSVYERLCECLREGILFLA